LSGVKSDVEGASNADTSAAEARPQQNSLRKARRQLKNSG